MHKVKHRSIVSYASISLKWLESNIANDLMNFTCAVLIKLIWCFFVFFSWKLLLHLVSVSAVLLVRTFVSWLEGRGLDKLCSRGVILMVTVYLSFSEDY